MGDPGTSPFSSYLPARLRGRIAARGVAPESEDRFDAAILFTDISGFTPLTARLAQRGPRGVERLNELLEQVFKPLIDRILDAGGDIISFAGDAIVAAWPTSEARSPEQGAFAAVRCAIACRDLIATLPELHQAGLRLRTGVGAGGCTLRGVGGLEGRWVCVASGEALIRTGQAERAALADEVLLSDEVVGRIAEAFALERDARGWRIAATPGPAPTPPPATPPPGGEPGPELLRAWLPDAVLSRVDAGQTRWLAELRTVSAVFVRLRHLDPSQAGQGEALQAFVLHLQELLRRWGGTLNKLLCSDRGTTLVLAYGFPPHAHEDDAVRAVRTATRIAEHCRARGLAFGVGVTTGRVFSGACGSPRRREYTMLGASVNLAARLMGHADGEVLCDERTVRDSMERLAYEALQPVHIRGLQAPVPVARPAGERDLSGRHEVLLSGRVDALAASRSGSLTPARYSESAGLSTGAQTLGTGAWSRSR